MFKASWLCKQNGDDLEPAFALRREVFCDEQGYSPQIEYDTYDETAQHIIIVENGTVVATGRLFEKDGLYTIGRICVKKSARGQGYGDMLVRLILDKALQSGAQRLYISSQEYIKGFYAKFGFVQQGESYRHPGEMSDHVDMFADAEDIVFPSECGA